MDAFDRQRHRESRSGTVQQAHARTARNQSEDSCRHVEATSRRRINHERSLCRDTSACRILVDWGREAAERGDNAYFDMGRDEEKLKEQMLQGILQDAWTPNRKQSIIEKREHVILEEQNFCT